MINWKVRVKSKVFWLAIIPAALLLAQTVLAMFGITWDCTAISDQLIAIVNAAFAFLAILGIVADPTTQGIGDSERAIKYTEPARKKE